MSENRDIISGVITERQVWSGDSVRNLRTGSSFTAELEEVPDIELATELGRDARESIILHISDRSAAAACQINDQVEVTLYGAKIKLKLLRRSDNPTSPQVDFWCQKLVPGKDQ